MKYSYVYHFIFLSIIFAILILNIKLLGSGFCLSASIKTIFSQYLFLDLAHILEGEEAWATDLVDSLIKFPSAFSLPPSIIKLTQD